jgi:hypothetical protein
VVDSLSYIGPMRCVMSLVPFLSSGVSLAQSSVDAERLFREARDLVTERKFPLARPLEPTLGTLVTSWLLGRETMVAHVAPASSGLAAAIGVKR